MSANMQPSPVVFFPPALAPNERVNNMDFRPLPMTDEEAKTAEKDVPDADPKGSSAQESVISSANEVDPQNTPSLPQPPAIPAPVVKDSTPPKENGNSTQTS